MAAPSGRTSRPMDIRYLHLPRRAGGGWRDWPWGRVGRGTLPYPLSALLVASLVYLLLRPVLALLHAVVVLGVAAGLHALAASGAVAWLASNGPLDPVYKSVMLWTLTGIEPV